MVVGVFDLDQNSNFEEARERISKFLRHHALSGTIEPNNTLFKLNDAGVLDELTQRLEVLNESYFTQVARIFESILNGMNVGPLRKRLQQPEVLTESQEKTENINFKLTSALDESQLLQSGDLLITKHVLWFETLVTGLIAQKKAKHIREYLAVISKFLKAFLGQIGRRRGKGGSGCTNLYVSLDWAATSGFLSDSKRSKISPKICTLIK